MMIVSQDKTVLTDNIKLVIIENEDIVYIVSREKGELIKLGIYKTEERAKEVLQEISFKYEASKLCKYDFKNATKELGYTINDYSPVYFMPRV